MMNAGKRERSANFDDEERYRLLDILETSEDRGILESKMKDSVTLRKKNDLWREIALKFNATSHRSRSEKQLHELWQNIRKKAKKDYSVKRRSSFKTGGGPPDPPVAAVSERAAALMGSSTMDPLPGIPDNDDISSNDGAMCENSVVIKSQSSTVFSKKTVNQLQIQLLEEKIQQQRTLHAAQMDLIMTMKSAVQTANGNETQVSYLKLLDTSNFSDFN